MRKVIFLLLIFILFTSACQNAAEQEALAATYAAQTFEADKANQDAQASEIAKNVASTQAAESTASEAAAILTREAVPTFTFTPKPTKTPNATQLRKDATVALVAQLFEDGLVPTTDGRYVLLDDFDESWAQLQWFRWFETGESPANFVLRTDMTWDSASDSATLWSTACGFVFRGTDDGYYVVFVAMNGYVNIQRRSSASPISLGQGYFGKPGFPSGGAEFMMIVSGQSFTVFIDKEQVFSTRDHAFTEGELAYTVLSGTNKDYGTRCQMTDTDLWILGDS